MSEQKQRVIIAGGGLIGLCTAVKLLESGHEVVILDKSKLGSGAATGNAGELTPQQVAPLASANTAKDIVKGLFSRGHYLSIDPLKLLQLAPFGLGFLWSSRKRGAAYGAAALAQFSPEILPALHRMGELGIDTSGGGEGYLMTSSDEAELRSSFRNYTERALKGWGTAPTEILRGEKLHKFEPTLQPAVSGAVYLPAEFSLDSVTFVASMIEFIKNAGAEIIEGATVTRVLKDAAGFEYKTANGDIKTVHGDKAVLATGAWTSRVLRNSHVLAVGVVSGKGYSFTVPVEKMPQHLIHAMDHHCVMIPMHDRLRVVGMMEFDNRPYRFNQDRIKYLAQAASNVLQGADWEKRTDEWVGPRPMTADGMPLFDYLPGRKDVIVCAGHNMHGLSLGPVNAEVIRNMIEGRASVIGGKEISLHPFRLKR